MSDTTHAYKYIADWSPEEVKDFLRALDETDQVSDLSDWELEFLENMLQWSRDFTDNQLAIIGGLAMRYNDLLNS